MSSSMARRQRRLAKKRSRCAHPAPFVQPAGSHAAVQSGRGACVMAVSLSWAPAGSPTTCAVCSRPAVEVCFFGDGGPVEGRCADHWPEGA
jgi:hypothetical protein